MQDRLGISLWFIKLDVSKAYSDAKQIIVSQKWERR